MDECCCMDLSVPPCQTYRRDVFFNFHLCLSPARHLQTTADEVAKKSRNCLHLLLYFFIFRQVNTAWFAFASTLGVRQEKEQVVFKSCLRTIRVKAFFIGRSCCLLRRWRRWLGCTVTLSGPKVTQLLFHKLSTVSQISREREREGLKGSEEVETRDKQNG